MTCLLSHSLAHQSICIDRFSRSFEDNLISSPSNTHSLSASLRSFVFPRTLSCWLTLVCSHRLVMRFAYRLFVTSQSVYLSIIPQKCKKAMCLFSLSI